MYGFRLKILSCMIWCILPFHLIHAYDLGNVRANFNFGTITSPFPDLTITDGTVCVAYSAGTDQAAYYVRATSRGSATSAFQLTNTTNNTYKLAYSVSWAGSSGGSPTFVALSSGTNSPSTFTAQPLGGLTCAVLPNNASLQLKLLNVNQVLAKQGSYTDTLTILINAILNFL